MDRPRHTSGARSMPNRPALVGAGATGLYADAHAGRPTNCALCAERRRRQHRPRRVGARAKSDIEAGDRAFRQRARRTSSGIAELMAEAGRGRQGLDPVVAKQAGRPDPRRRAGQLVATEAQRPTCAAHERGGYFKRGHHRGGARTASPLQASSRAGRRCHAGSGATQPRAGGAVRQPRHSSGGSMQAIYYIRRHAGRLSTRRCCCCACSCSCRVRTSATPSAAASCSSPIR